MDSYYPEEEEEEELGPEQEQSCTEQYMMPGVPDIYPHNEMDNFHINHTFVGIIQITTQIIDGSGQICWHLIDPPGFTWFKIFASSNGSYVSRSIMVANGCVLFEGAMFKIYFAVSYGGNMERAEFYANL